MKKLRMNNPQPPFPFPIPTLRLSDTSPTKDFMTKFKFFCSKYPHRVPIVGSPYNPIKRHGFSQQKNNKFE